MDSMTHSISRISSHARGFTLAELAIVLVIVGLLLGGLMVPLSTQYDIRNINDTQKTLNEIRDALLGYAAANGRLPRPATSAVDGTEMTAACADPACTGFIPWATLGVPKLDSWGKLIRYSVTPDYANDSITLSTVANRTVQTRDSAGLSSYLAGQATCSTANQCVPAIVFSHGKNHWGTTDSGISLPDGSASNSDEDANNSGPTSYFSRIPSDNTTNTGGEFDDIVIWISPNTLFNRMIAAGQLP
jgi:prepilin-type N-terminal cleavage/methylation domain-containing protein